MRNCWIVLAIFFSFSALAEVSRDEKLGRVQLIQDISAAGIPVDVQSYQRELQYDDQKLTVDERAEREANLLADKIRAQVLAAYQEGMKANDNPDAVAEEIKKEIENDLALARPELQDELRKIAMDALDAAEKSGMSQSVSSSSLEDVMKENIHDRMLYLNAEPGLNNQNESAEMNQRKTSDADRLSYDSVTELGQSLASTKENARWVSTSYKSTELGRATVADSNITAHLKFKFLGTGIEGGPSITFSNKMTIKAIIMSEGSDIAYNSDGSFNRWVIGDNGKPVMKNGKNVRNFLAMYCEYSSEVSSGYKGEATVSVELGAGSFSNSTSLARYDTTSQTQSSRRVLLPDSIGGKIVNTAMIQQTCFKVYPNSLVRKGLTVKQSLALSQRNLLSGLVFSHPKTKCATDTQCMPWARGLRLSDSVKRMAFPRCVEEPTEKYRYCKMKGLQNVQCPVYDHKKLVSAESIGGYFDCDNGLHCNITSPALYVPGTSWLFRAAVGTCQPNNTSTYRRPIFR
jgi:hypothetical protein